MQAFSFLLMIFISMSVASVSGSGVFQLRFDWFLNPFGVDSKGECCRGFKKLSSSFDNGKCTETCRTQFRVCLKHYRTSIDLSGPCTYGEFLTPVLVENWLSFVNNGTFTNDKNSTMNHGRYYTVNLPFEFTWPGVFSLIIEAYHQSLDNSSEKVLVMQAVLNRGYSSSNTWKVESFSSNSSPHILDYRYRVQCDKNYYGDGCDNLCRSRDDKFGHYACTKPHGDKVCLPGWSGEYCTRAICLPGCLEEHGFCDEPDECQCKLGWQGVLCDQCIRYPGCQHGSCQEPYQCNCNEGWGGLFCNKDLNNYCTNYKPCKNGGTCFNSDKDGSYNCTCPVGYTGTDCELLKDDCTVIPCLNGGICSSENNNALTCDCPTGFNGRHCEIPLTEQSQGGDAELLTEPETIQNNETLIRNKMKRFKIYKTKMMGKRKYSF